jgi:hypothetical protein
MSLALVQRIAEEGVQPDMRNPTDLSDYHDLIASALDHGGGLYLYDDIAERVLDGRMQFWPGVTSMCITEIIAYPRSKSFHIFLAAGNQQELEIMAPAVLGWGADQGCASAIMYGRPGWERSFLGKTGWQKTHMAVLTKQLIPSGKDVECPQP